MVSDDGPYVPREQGPTVQTPRDERVQRMARTQSATDLLRDLSNGTVELVRKEIALAKAEMSEKARSAGRNSIVIVVGALLAYVGFLALTAALILGLGVLLRGAVDEDVAAWLSPLIVGLLYAVIGGVVAYMGIQRLKNTRLVPEKTVETMRENKQWLENEIR